MCIPWESNPRRFALLTQCSTTEPQEHFYMLKVRHAPKWVAVNRTVFDKVEWVLFYMTIEEF